MIKSKMIRMGVTALGFLFMTVATVGANVASWTVIHNEPVPEEMK